MSLLCSAVQTKEISQTSIPTQLPKEVLFERYQEYLKTPQKTSFINNRTFRQLVSYGLPTLSFALLGGSIHLLISKLIYYSDVKYIVYGLSLFEFLLGFSVYHKSFVKKFLISDFDKVDKKIINWNNKEHNNRNVRSKIALYLHTIADHNGAFLWSPHILNPASKKWLLISVAMYPGISLQQQIDKVSDFFGCNISLLILAGHGDDAEDHKNRFIRLIGTYPWGNAASTFEKSKNLKMSGLQKQAKLKKGKKK